MRKISTLATAGALALISTAALAQLRDNSLPAGSAVLSGAPSGGPGIGARSSVPPVTTTSPSTGRSSPCIAEPCGTEPIIAPERRGRR